jgi:hypothetical protein
MERVSSPASATNISNRLGEAQRGIMSPLSRETLGRIDGGYERNA